MAKKQYFGFITHRTEHMSGAIYNVRLLDGKNVKAQAGIKFGILGLKIGQGVQLENNGGKYKKITAKIDNLADQIGLAMLIKDKCINDTASKSKKNETGKDSRKKRAKNRKNPRKTYNNSSNNNNGRLSGSENARSRGNQRSPSEQYTANGNNIENAKCRTSATRQRGNTKG